MAWLGSRSANLKEHLWRGAIAALLLIQAVAFLRLGAGPMWLLLAASQVVFAVPLLRGCPMCWTAGLISTLSSAPRDRRTPS